MTEAMPELLGNMRGKWREDNHQRFEHIALNTDDYPGTLAKLRASGVRVLEEVPPNNGRRVCFLEAPDGAQVEVIEKA